MVIFYSIGIISYFCSYNTSHKFCDQFPSLHYQCYFQVSETVSWHKLWCSYTSNILQHWVRGKDLIYFCKVDRSRSFINVSRNSLGLVTKCEGVTKIKSVVIWFSGKTDQTEIDSFSEEENCYEKWPEIETYIVRLVQIFVVNLKWNYVIWNNQKAYGNRESGS